MELKQPKALTGRFALICGAIIVAAGVALFYGSRESSVADLRAMAERNNIALTKAFANAIWPKFAGFVRSAGGLETDDLRRHPQTAALRAATVEQMRGLAVVKVKIYDLDGLTAFSTDPGQIGEDKSANAGFLAARAGHVVSELSHRDTFSAFEQEIVDRDLLSSYIPITGANGAIEGVFEIYYDLTELLARIRRSSERVSMIVAITLSVLYLLVLAALYRRDRLIARQYAENIALAEEAASAAEQSRMKSEFLANMSHELRTPLNAILGFSESMRNEVFGAVGSERYRGYVDDIWKSGRHLLGIVDDVLDMSKIETGGAAFEFAATDVKEIFYACIRMMAPAAQKKRVQIKAVLPSSIPQLHGDERRISQALLNVLSNAIKFSPEDSSVEVSARLNEAGGLTIAVSDIGCGIEPDDIPVILTPFGQVGNTYERGQGGTGLGLPIAKSIVELHGGDLTLNSRPGVGTTVRLTFPASQLVGTPPRRARPVSPDDSPTRPRGDRIAA